MDSCGRSSPLGSGEDMVVTSGISPRNERREVLS